MVYLLLAVFSRTDAFQSSSDLVLPIFYFLPVMDKATTPQKEFYPVFQEGGDS